MREKIRLSKITLMFVVLVCCCLAMFLTSLAAGEETRNESSVNGNTSTEQGQQNENEIALTIEGNDPYIVNNQNIVDSVDQFDESNGKAATHNAIIGESITSGGCEWEIDENGTLSIKKTSFPESSEYEPGQLPSNSPWKNCTDIYKVVVNDGVYTNESAERMFEYCSNIVSIDFSGLSVASETTNLSFMFSYCKKLTTIIVDDSKWNVDNVSSSDNMFEFCESLKGGLGTPFSNEHTDKEYARIDCGEYSDSPGYLTAPYSAYGGCDWDIDDSGTLNITKASKPLEGYDPGKMPSGQTSKGDWPWDMKRSNIKKIVFGQGIVMGDSMNNMFSHCDSLISIDFSDLNTSEVVNTAFAFFYSSLTSLDLSSFDMQKLDAMASMFDSCSEISALTLPSTLNTSNVANMEAMFNGCKKLISLDLTMFDTSKVTNMKRMFKDCSELTKIKVEDSKWSTEIADGNEMFQNCSKIKGSEGTAYDASHVNQSYACIDGDNASPGYLTGPYTWAEIGECRYTISYRGKLIINKVTDKTGKLPDNYTESAHWPWNDKRSAIKQVAIGEGVVAGDSLANIFCHCGSLKSVDISKLDTSKAIYMSNMFSQCSDLTSLDLSNFNASNVVDMSGMFYNCTALTSLDLSNFSTSKVVNMSDMFKYCYNLISLDFSNFNVSNVENMSGMFFSCNSLTSLDLSNFSTSKVVNMSKMFYKCSAITTIYVDAGWITDLVTSSSDMFDQCKKIKGGAGTTYDANHIDKEYARIDGGPGSGIEGYLTASQGSMTPLTFTAEEPNSSVTFKWSSGSDVQYSTDGNTWIDYSAGTEISMNNIGDKVSFKGTNINTSEDNHFNMNGKIAGSGDVTSLTNGAGGDTTLNNNCYMCLFKNCKSLTTGADLPATSLSENCYCSMYEGCSNLTNAPLLPATSLASDCYSYMFKGCTGLTTTPLLSSTTLADRCYYYMFDGCAGLSKVSELPATSLKSSCYKFMYNDCSGIKLYEEGSGDAWSIPADVEVATDWGYNMFSGTGGTLTGQPTPGMKYYYTKLNPIGDCTIEDIPDQVYTGSAISPNVVVKDGDKPLTEGTDYTVTYSNNVNVGTATVTITGFGSYTGTKTTTFNIKNDISYCTVETIPDQSYTGSEIKPKPVVKHGTTTLVQDTDYTVSYENNKNVGTATVTITGKGNYLGTISKTFNIVAKSIDCCTIEDIPDQKYTGSAISPNVVVKDGDKALTEDTYTVTYSNNINVGTATVTIAGCGNYTGTKTTTFNIKYDISYCSVETIPDQSYTGSEIKPKPVVKHGTTTLVQDTDYTVSYADNTEVGTATVTITGCGNYTGTKTTTFNIVAKSIDCCTIEDISDQVYTGSAISPNVVVKDGDKALTENTDYTVTYSDNVNVGIATVTIAGCGSYTGNKTTTFTISPKDISLCDVEDIVDQIYTGKEIEPTVEVKDLERKLVLTKDDDYEVDYSNNTNIGEAKVTITGIGNYANIDTATFTIRKADSYDEIPVTPGKIVDITNSESIDDCLNPFGVRINNADILSTILGITDEEIAQGVNVFITATDNSSTITDKDKGLIDEVRGDFAVGQYLDFLLYKKVGNNESQLVTDLNSNLNVSFNVLDELQKQDRSYAVVRVHNSVASVLNSLYDPDEHIITFESDGFSPYALTYKDVANDDDSSDVTPAKTTSYDSSNVITAQTSDNCMILSVITFMMIVFLSSVLLMFSSIKRRN